MTKQDLERKLALLLKRERIFAEEIERRRQEGEELSGKLLTVQAEIVSTREALDGLIEKEAATTPGAKPA